MASPLTEGDRTHPRLQILEDHGYPALVLTGNDSQLKRTQILDAVGKKGLHPCGSGKYGHILIGSKVTLEGLNLTTFSITLSLVGVSPSWRLPKARPDSIQTMFWTRSEMDQLIGRTYRRGQTEPVIVRFLLLSDSYDTVMEALAANKLATGNSLLGSTNAAGSVVPLEDAPLPIPMEDVLQKDAVGPDDMSEAPTGTSNRSQMHD